MNPWRFFCILTYRKKLIFLEFRWILLESHSSCFVEGLQGGGVVRTPLKDIDCDGCDVYTYQDNCFIFQVYLYIQITPYQSVVLMWYLVLHVHLDLPTGCSKYWPLVVSIYWDIQLVLNDASIGTSIEVPHYVQILKQSMISINRVRK